MAIPTSRGRIAWWLVAAILAGIVVSVLVAFTGTVVLGLFFYYVARPAYRRYRRRLRPAFAAASALLSLALPVVLLAAYTLAIAIQELDRLAETVDLGSVVGEVEPYLDVSELVRDPAAILQDPDVVEALRLVASGAIDYVPLIAVSALELFVSFIIAFYLLRDGDRLSGWLLRTVGSDRGTVEAYLRAVDEDLESVFFGNILNALITAAIAVIVFSLLNLIAPAGGVPYPALVGVLAGAASLIPAVGMKLVYVPLAIGLGSRAAVEGDPLWFPIVFLLVAAVVVDFIPDLVLRPYVSGRNLHVGLVMIAYIVGPLLFGWYGLFLGPLVLVVVFHFGRYVVPELAERTQRESAIAGVSSTGTPDPPRPAYRPPIPRASRGRSEDEHTQARRRDSPTDSE